MTERALDDLARRVMLDASRQEYGSLMDERPEHDFSPEFEREMKKLIHRADHPVRWRWMWAGRIAAILAALLMLASVSAAAVGCDLWGWLVLWTRETFTLAPGQINYIDPDDLRIPEEPGEYASLQEALTAYGLDGPLMPRRLPEGFEMDQLIVDADTIPSQIIFASYYRRGEDNLSMQVDVYLEQEGASNGNFAHFQKDEGDPILYEAGGVTHLLATNAGRPVALWANGPAECAISGNITMEELKTMLDSIYE